MAVTYCTDRELKDVFPDIDSYDSKTIVTGWVKELDGYGGGSTIDLWYSYNTGLITELFIDGNKIAKIAFPTTQTTQLNGAVADGASGATLDDASALEQYDIIRIDNEYLSLSIDPSGNTIYFVGARALFGTQSLTHADDTSVYLARDESDYDAVDYYVYFYDSTLDLCVLTVPDSIDPNDNLVESGEDWATLKTRYRENASRYLESHLDRSISREIAKDKDGNYPYNIVRTTALIASVFAIRSKDPTSDIASVMWEEVLDAIKNIAGGAVKVGEQVTKDSAKGVIREKSVSGSLRIVDTRGRYSGVYDRIGVKITTAGAIGTAKYDVWTADSNKLGAERMNDGDTANISGEIINGQYQSCAGGLQIRFSGDTGDTATENDNWELEVWGYQEEVDNPKGLSRMRMSRFM